MKSVLYTSFTIRVKYNVNIAQLKYVPPVIGIKSGVRKTFNGQPP